MMKRELILFSLIASLALGSSAAWQKVGDSVVAENQHGMINVTPHTVWDLDGRDLQQICEISNKHTFSVSITQITSPFCHVSPSFFTQVAILPEVIASSSLGIITVTAIVLPPRVIIHHQSVACCFT